MKSLKNLQIGGTVDKTNATQTTGQVTPAFPEDSFILNYDYKKRYSTYHKRGFSNKKVAKIGFSILSFLRLG